MTPEETDAINKQMNNYLNNYKHETDQQELERIYLYLAEKQTFTSLQYRFFCWVGNKLNRPVKLNNPHLSVPSRYEPTEFSEKFLYSLKRAALYAILTDYIKQLRTRYKLTGNIDLLIGGSFTDPNYGNPRDIDAIILLSEHHLENPELHEVYQKITNKIPDGIDIHFLPTNYNTSCYKAYSNISHLASKPANKQKGAEVANNSFEPRELVKITL